MLSVTIHMNQVSHKIHCLYSICVWAKNRLCLCLFFVSIQVFINNLLSTVVSVGAECSGEQLADHRTGGRVCFTHGQSQRHRVWRAQVSDQSTFLLGCFPQEMYSG